MTKAARTAKSKDRLTIILKKGNRRMQVSTPVSNIDRFIFILNRQFTNAPNTTQISSGAGRSSAAGNNAAINSPNTRQQQSVGAGGTARNKGAGSKGAKGLRYANPLPVRTKRSGKHVVIVVNDQVVKLPKGQRTASATQVTSGAGTYSTGGTNSAIESRGTRQQHAVGGGGTATNKWTRSSKKKRPAKRRQTASRR
ncbi:hypothetical protein SFC15_17765 [Shouchella clausii]